MRVKFVCTDILFQLGHEEGLQIFKAETPTVESSLLDVMCVVWRTKMEDEVEKRKEPVMSSARHLADAVPCLAEGWVLGGSHRAGVGPCLAWSWTLGQGTGWEGPPRSWGSEVALRDLLCCWLSLWPKHFHLLLWLQLFCNAKTPSLRKVSFKKRNLLQKAWVDQKKRKYQQHMIQTTGINDMITCLGQWFCPIVLPSVFLWSCAEKATLNQSYCVDAREEKMTQKWK